MAFHVRPLSVDSKTFVEVPLITSRRWFSSSNCTVWYVGKPQGGDSLPGIAGIGAAEESAAGSQPDVPGVVHRDRVDYEIRIKGLVGSQLWPPLTETATALRPATATTLPETPMLTGPLTPGSVSRRQLSPEFELTNRYWCGGKPPFSRQL